MDVLAVEACVDDSRGELSAPLGLLFGRTRGPLRGQQPQRAGAHLEDLSAGSGSDLSARGRRVVLLQAGRGLRAGGVGTGSLQAHRLAGALFLTVRAATEDRRRRAAVSCTAGDGGAERGIPGA